ncbi:hypothetical protein FEM03_08875 [Phragmitibacter flavus]|uniref:3-methyladenine DNA glycosylase n=1 Tax=Phragmitibacter flavus TaxID=2576071 RepID=A0A5R8KFY4_9BACT|nr:hypothetical protein FEM03_08875 [Phragmitibacter flavus]
MEIEASVWELRQSQHRARVVPHAEAFVQRRACGEKHPVWDFLFTYYNFSPNKLLTWIPGLHQREEFIANLQHTVYHQHAFPVPKPRDLHQARWIASLCSNILAKPARFGCHGLHEWAMVYRQSEAEIRHNQHPLRLPAKDIADLIESQPLCCTHYDAFRFFTPPATPLNAIQPTLETRHLNEQAGCLHANMDLYKWAGKLWPWIGSDLVADTFELAVIGRAMDMRASPYDLAHLGFDPIPIETEAGREQYRREQQDLTALANPIRQRLQHACENLLESFPSEQN